MKLFKKRAFSGRRVCNTSPKESCVFNFRSLKVLQRRETCDLQSVLVTFGEVHGRLAGLGVPSPERKVSSVVGRFCRNVAERETRVLPAGRQQDHMGSPGEIPAPVSGRLRRLRIREVRYFVCWSHNFTSIHLDEACAARAKVKG